MKLIQSLQSNFTLVPSFPIPAYRLLSKPLKMSWLRVYNLFLQSTKTVLNIFGAQLLSASVVIAAGLDWTSSGSLVDR